MARCVSCDHINDAGAPVCKQCGTAIGSVCVQCGAGNPLLARFCCGCGARIEAPTGMAAVSLSRPERRQVTILFFDLLGSTELSRALDPEDWHGLLHRLHSELGAIVAEHHGHVAQYLGDGLLAYFGYPVAGQDDARCAVSAGLGMLRHVDSIHGDRVAGVRARVGIHTGLVVIGNVGSNRHQESLAFGESTNLAARIQGLAPPDSVVVSPQTFRLVEPFFRSSELGSFTPKGFEGPLILHRIHDESGLTTRFEAASASGLTPLVGRAEETAILHDAWQSALAGGAPVLLLLGEAGIGKSRLIHVVQELTEERARFIELRCSEHARASAFAPLTDWLQRRALLRDGEPAEETMLKLGRHLGPHGLSEQQIALVGSLFAVPVAPELMPAAGSLRPGILDAFRTWITSSKIESPTVLAVEDLQWADPSTLELLGDLIERRSQSHLVTVLTARPEFSAPWMKAERVRLIAPHRLAAGDASKMIAFVTKGKALPPEVLERIESRAEGIPLFLEEMTKSLLESGVLRETGAGYQLDRPTSEQSIPATIHDSLMSRLDQLGHCKPIAQLAALLGREFDVALLEAVWRRLVAAPKIDLYAALHRVAQAEVIFPSHENGETRYHFKHSLLQHAAYESLLRSARRDYHRSAAEALVSDFPAQTERQPELVARHYAGAQMSEQAAEFWNKAGQRALATSAYVEAGAHFRAALEQLAQLTSSPERARKELDLCVALGVTLIATRGYAAPEVEQTYSKAAALCHQLGTELPLRVLYGVWVVNFVGSNLASSRLMVPNLEQLAHRNRDQASSLVPHAALASWAFWQGQHVRVGEYHAAARPRLDERDPKKQHEALLQEYGFEGLLYPVLYHAWSLVITGEAAPGLERWREAVSLAEQMQDPYITCAVLVFGAAIHHDLGMPDVQRRLADEAHAIASDKRFMFWLALALGHRGIAMAANNESAAGIASLEQGLAILKGAGVKTTYSYFLAYLAEAETARGHVDRALSLLDEALEMARHNVDAAYEAEMLRLRAEACWARGELDAAQRSLMQALDSASSQQAKLFELRAATSLARVLTARGEQAEGKRLLARIRASFAEGTELPPLRSADALLRSM